MVGHEVHAGRLRVVPAPAGMGAVRGAITVTS